MSRWATPLLVLLILAVAFWLRVPSYNWDQGQDLHPDEVLVASAVGRLGSPTGPTDPGHSPLNPRRDGAAYPYGALPVYLGGMAFSLTGQGIGDSGSRTMTSIIHAGRVVSGLFDVLTTLLVFFVGMALSGATVGLVASALYALAVLPIQLSHFYTSETFMTTFMTAALLCGVLLLRNRARWLMLLAGGCCGLAVACKLSALPVLAVPLAAILVWRAQKERPSWREVGTCLALAGVGTLLGIFAGDPFAILDAPTYMAQVRDQAAIQSGASDVWFTRSYVGTWPVLYQGWQLILVGAGPLVGIAGMAGALLAGVRAWRERIWAWALLLVGAGVYFASIAFLEAKWTRYLLPLVPYLCLFAAFVALEAFGARVARYALAALLITLTGLAALAFSAIYGSDNTRVQASRWIYENVPRGAAIARELNDVPLPLPLSSHTPDQEYRLLNLRMLGDQQSPQVLDMLKSTLSQADYLVVAGGRVQATIPRLPWRYPVQNRYYDLLFGGQLGFTPAYTATAYSSILGLQIPDTSWADVSFIEQDHAPVHIFRKTRTLSDGEWAALFAQAVRQPSIASRTPPR